MNREFLEGLGLEKEAIDNIMKEHGKSVNATKHELETVTTDRDELKTQLTDRDKQLEELSAKAKGNEELTAEIERLKNENTTTAADYQAKLDKQAFDFTLDKSLTGAKVRNPKAVKALLDTEKIKLDGSKLLNLDDQLAALKESDPYLFETEEKPGLGGRTPHTPSGQAPTGITKEQFEKMNYTERVKLHTENPELYTKLQL